MMANEMEKTLLRELVFMESNWLIMEQHRMGIISDEEYLKVLELAKGSIDLKNKILYEGIDESVRSEIQRACNNQSTVQEQTGV